MSARSIRGIDILSAQITIASFYFSSQCKQHDFGPHFGGSLRLDPTETRRKSVDNHFYGRMNARCGAWQIRYWAGAVIHDAGGGVARAAASDDD